jgi:hypothetical protein
MLQRAADYPGISITRVAALMLPLLKFAPSLGYTRIPDVGRSAMWQLHASGD